MMLELQLGIHFIAEVLNGVEVTALCRPHQTRAPFLYRPGPVHRDNVILREKRLNTQPQNQKHML